MSERIGVFICECGPNMKEALHFSAVVERASNLPGVALAQGFPLYCSEEGQAQMAQVIRDHRLTRVVFAGCSPREHEAGFRRVLESAGLNPYLLQVANIREQCTWVIKDKDAATAAADRLIEAAVRRVERHEPLEPRSFPITPDVLVVGSGVAGLSAALTLAQKGRRVVLIEKGPSVGGRVARWSEVAPGLECASCMLEPVVDSVLHHDRIEVRTLTEATGAVGFHGRFTVTLRRRARFVDEKACVGCGACLEVCPVKTANEHNQGLDERRAIYNPYRGALPNIPLIDRDLCVRFQGQSCTLCKDACPFDALRYEEQDGESAVEVGAVVLATGLELFDLERAPEYAHGRAPGVYTWAEAELLVNKSGPTGGRLVLRDGTVPRRIALIHCVGSRTARHNEHCSGICCLGILKLAHLLRAHLPDAEIVDLHSEWVLGDKGGEAFYRKVAAQDRIRFERVEPIDQVAVEPREGRLDLKVPGRTAQDPLWRGFDMVILGVGLEGAPGNAGLGQVFDVPLEKGGFFAEAHGKLDPAGTAIEGVLVAGCAQWPKSIEGSVLQGQAAAGKALSRLVPGENLTTDPCVAFVVDRQCSGCKMCLGVCPYHAIGYDRPRNRAVISDILCKGCGVCVAGCPSGAIEGRHFTNGQVLAEMRALLREPLA